MNVNGMSERFLFRTVVFGNERGEVGVSSEELEVRSE